MNNSINLTDEELILQISPGDTAWMLTSSALVMLMTPGLAFFYGGLVKGKNMINTMMMSFSTLGLVTIQWVLIGYTFGFGGGNSIWGNFQFAGLKNVGTTPYEPYSATIPHLLYSVFQLMFAIITAAIVSGGVVERMKFVPYLVFIFLWTTLVYDPIAHWLWSAYFIGDNIGFGWLRALGAIDFAGGNVVHISSGISGLVAAAIVGPRPELKTEKKKIKKKKQPTPAHIPYVLLGGALLWFGWFGFNSGSAVAANGLAAIAFVNTQISTAMALTVWMILDIVFRGAASAEGATSGAVVGLVGITPCAGYVHVQSSLAIGALSSIVCYFTVKAKSKYFPRYFPQLDDSLDVFTCHGVGGMVGSLLLGFFASKEVNSYGSDGVFFGNPILLGYQCAAVISTISWSAFFTALILIPMKLACNGLTVHESSLRLGMDRLFHGTQAQSGFTNQEEQVNSSINDGSLSSNTHGIDKEGKKAVYNDQINKALHKNDL